MLFYYRSLSVWSVLFFHVCLLGAAQSLGNDTFRVLTYNIRYANPGDKQDRWENRKETVVQTILDADVAGLQEVLSRQQVFIQNHTPGWEWLAVGRDDGQKRGEMCSIGWKADRFIAIEQGTFWLSTSPYRIGKSGWDAALPRIASWVRLIPRWLGPDGKSDHTAANASDELNGDQEITSSLLLVNTHFDHRGAEARRQSSALLRRWVAERQGDSQVLLIGDLNARLESPPLRELLEIDLSEYPALRDTREHSRAPDSGPDSTWNGFREIVPGQRIDHVLFLGDRLVVEKYLTLDPRTPDGRFASDHLPIIVELRL